MSEQSLVSEELSSKSLKIHATAIVDTRAQIDSSVEIGPYAVIGPHVKIGPHTIIGPHCVIQGHTTIGEHNHFFPFSSIGAQPQDKKYAGEATALEIGNHNTIREFCTFNCGTLQGTGVTRLGHHNWIMAYVHLAHDCQVGNHTIFANNAQLAGHVVIGDWVVMGGFTTVHQFVQIGAHAMTSLSSVVVQDVPPYVLAAGNIASAHGINSEGLRRRGFNSEQITLIKRAYRILYKSGNSFEQAKTALAEQVQQHPNHAELLNLFLNFLCHSTRGIVR